MRDLLLILSILLFLVPTATGQHFSGRWVGTLTQEGKTGTFAYELDLRQEGETISGTSLSTSPDGNGFARFEITGIWNGKVLTLQELRQIEPEVPKWCVKYAILRFPASNDPDRLTGNWRAPGCTPGMISLERVKTSGGDTTVTEELPFSMPGVWTGHLSQSDRDYGFFFELRLDTLPTGHSFIVSEGNGGEAIHALHWSFDEVNNQLVFKELQVQEKTDARWKWCIKRGSLKLDRDGTRYVLEGPWEGFIEGYDPTLPKARCAPGRLYLEKPVLTQQLIRRSRELMKSYESSNKRPVKVERTLEVRSRDLRIRVWDNGTVDGDVVTLFLNGRRILHNFRVTKHKWSIPVTLEEDNNFLILHAEDLGDISPNTVAVAVDDGFTEQIIILSSNLRESGAVLIREFSLE